MVLSESPARPQGVEPAATKLEFIDWLRGLAILMVIGTHIKGIVAGVHPITTAALSFGRMGVQLFFIASAYTLCLSWESRCNSSAHRLTDFYLRRWFRIAPIYYVGIVFYALKATFTFWMERGLVQFPEQYTFLSVTANFLLIHGFYPPGYNNIVPGGWSIGTEFAFYMLFPFIYGAIRTRAGSLWSTLALPLIYIAALFGVHLAAVYAAGFHMRLGDFWFHSIFNQLPVFLVGIVGMIWHQRYLRSVSAWVDGAGFVIFSGLALAIWNRDGSLYMSLLPLMCGLAFVCLLYLSSRPGGGHLPLLQRVGRVSYSMYLWHFAVVAVAEHFVGAKVAGLKDAGIVLFYSLVVLITFAIARVSERFIERSGIQLGRAVIRRMKPNYPGFIQ